MIVLSAGLLGTTQSIAAAVCRLGSAAVLMMAAATTSEMHSDLFLESTVIPAWNPEVQRFAAQKGHGSTIRISWQKLHLLNGLGATKRFEEHREWVRKNPLRGYCQKRRRRRRTAVEVTRTSKNASYPIMNGILVDERCASLLN